MVDNVQTSAGTADGVVFATDDATGVHHPYVKIEFGADNTQTPVSSGNPLPVVQTGTPGLPTGAATAAKQPALGTAGSASADVISVQGIASGTAMAVSVASIPSHAVTNAGTFATQVDGAALTSLQLIDDVVVADDAAFTAGTTKVAMAGFVADESGTDSVNEDDGGAARMTLDRKQIMVPYAHAAGGATPAKIISAASTNATSVKASAGTLYSIVATNINAAIRYLKFYNKASSPTVGTDVPVFVVGIPGNTAGAGIVVPIPSCGLDFATGIALALTTGIADTDSTGVALNEIAVSYAYK